jgi:hypothetical protein
VCAGGGGLGVGVRRSEAYGAHVEDSRVVPIEIEERKAPAVVKVFVHSLALGQPMVGACMYTIATLIKETAT